MNQQHISVDLSSYHSPNLGLTATSTSAAAATSTSTTTTTTAHGTNIAGGLGGSSSGANNNNGKGGDNYGNIDVALPPLELMKRGEIEAQLEAHLSSATASQLWCRALASFEGEATASFIFFILVLTSSNSGLGIGWGALLQGLTVTVLTAIYARENVGHTDPMVTVLLIICGLWSLPWYFGFPVLLGNAVGACLATLIVWGLSPGMDRTLGLGFEPLRFGYTPGQGLGAQILGLAILYWVLLKLVSSAGGSKNFYEQMGGNFKRNSLFSLTIGLSHTIVSIGFGGIAGPNFGWYLHFFPGIISGQLDSSNWWYAFVAPLLALVLVLAWFFITSWISEMAFPSIFKKNRTYAPIHSAYKPKRV